MVLMLNLSIVQLKLLTSVRCLLIMLICKNLWLMTIRIKRKLNTKLSISSIESSTRKQMDPSKKHLSQVLELLSKTWVLVAFNRPKDKTESNPIKQYITLQIVTLKLGQLLQGNQMVSRIDTTYKAARPIKFLILIQMLLSSEKVKTE